MYLPCRLRISNVIDITWNFFCTRPCVQVCKLYTTLPNIKCFGRYLLCQQQNYSSKENFRQNSWDFKIWQEDEICIRGCFLLFLCNLSKFVNWKIYLPRYYFCWACSSFKPSPDRKLKECDSWSGKFGYFIFFYFFKQLMEPTF